MYAILISKALRLARVNRGSLSITCNPHVYPQVEWTIPAFTPQPQSITALWPVLISCPTLGRRLSWPWWLFAYLGGNSSSGSSGGTDVKELAEMKQWPFHPESIGIWRKDEARTLVRVPLRAWHWCSSDRKEKRPINTPFHKCPLERFCTRKHEGRESEWELFDLGSAGEMPLNGSCCSTSSHSSRMHLPANWNSRLLTAVNKLKPCSRQPHMSNVVE